MNFSSFILFPVCVIFHIFLNECILCVFLLSSNYYYEFPTIIQTYNAMSICFIETFSTIRSKYVREFFKLLGYMLQYRNKRMLGMFNQRSIGKGNDEKEEQMEHRRKKEKEICIYDSYFHSHHRRGNKRIMGVGKSSSSSCCTRLISL